jgi:hypothetical protein
MESTHTNTLESQDSKMGLGLVKRVAIVASDEMLSSEEGEVMMDFHVDNYNNLSKRIIAFLCIDSTNSIQSLDPIQLEVLALFIDSTRHVPVHTPLSL